MSYGTILVERDGPSLVITFNRPQRRNAVSLQMMHEILAAAKSVESDPTVGGVVLTGGSRLFSAGADLHEAQQVRSGEQGTRYFGSWHRLTRGLECLGKPVIAAIEGFCITGGLELALACDLRVAAAGSTYAITSARIGTVAGAGGTQRLPRVIGPARALEMLFAADPIPAEEAYRIGLVNRLVAEGGALAAAKEWTATYAARAPLSLGFVKRAVYRGMQMDLDSALESGTFLVTTIYGTADKQEGIAAFLEKRAPSFRDA